MRILIASDFHLGMKRDANFTAGSSAARELEARRVLGEILHTPHDYAVCVGDFFDQFSNPEHVILESLYYAEHFDAILAGNHDSSNRASVKSSLDVLAKVRGNAVIFESAQRLVGDTWLHFVPHCLTQDLFEHELENLLPKAGSANILFLHCNYAIGFEQDFASLNLSETRARQLLERFNHIVIGHIHTPQTLLDGRLHLVGSHFPTAFDNLTDKRHLVYDTTTGHLESIVHWRAEDNLYVGPPGSAPDGKQFYDFTEPADPKLAVKLFKQGAFGVRLPQVESARKICQLDRLEKLPDVVRRDLETTDPELFALWEELQHAD
jgi:DNA repair exonuclease SbcCD nuclease subunit